jgi:hypothetical protein
MIPSLAASGRSTFEAQRELLIDCLTSEQIVADADFEFAGLSAGFCASFLLGAPTEDLPVGEKMHAR